MADIRQSILRDSVDQIGSGSDITVDKLLRAIDDELTSPLRLIAHSNQSPPKVRIQGINITNPLTGRKHTIPSINNLLPNFASWENLTVNTTSGSGTVSVTKSSHGLSTGDLITVSTSTAVGGLSAGALSAVSVAVTVTDANTFTYTVGGGTLNVKATSTTSGSLDHVAYGGLITLPASNAGTITVTPTTQAAQTLTITSGSYMKIGVHLDASGNISITFGTEGVSISAATVPPKISNTFYIGFFVAKNVGGTIQPVINDLIYQFGSGGGGGSGSGDASGTLETFKNMLVDSPYELVTTYVSSIDESSNTKISAFGGTAQYSIVNSAVQFNAASDSVTSANMLDSSEFLANTTTGARDVSEVDVVVEWTAGSVDTAATYQVSRSGSDYKNLTMTRVGEASNMYKGSYRWVRNDEVAYFSDNAVVSNSLNMTNVSGTNESLAHLTNFTFATRVTGFGFRLSKSGSPLGSFRISIYNQSAGAPSSIVYAGAWTLASTLTGSAALVSVTSDITLPANTNFYLVIETDAAYKAGTDNTSNVIRVHADTTSGTDASRQDGGVWSAITTTTLSMRIDGFIEDFNTSVATYGQGNITTVDDLDSGSSRAFLSQAFTVSTTSVATRAFLYLNKVQSSGTLTGNLYLAIYKDSSGSPSSAADGKICESAAVDVTTISSGDSTVSFLIPNTPLYPGTYHLVLRSDAAYKASYVDGVREINWRSDGTSPPVVGKRSTDGTSWTAIANNFTYNLAGRTLNLKIKVISSAGSKMLTGFAVFYSPDSGIASGVAKKRQVFKFNGNTDNSNEFTVTQFLTDIDLLQVHHVETGQVYINPAFTMQGQKIVFPVNTFYSPTSNTVTLVASQNTGSSYDTTDNNIKLLAENHLGSVDATLDRSVPGRGIILRRPDGTLRELALDNSDNITIISVP